MRRSLPCPAPRPASRLGVVLALSLFLAISVVAAERAALKVLAIGNSFSNDATHLLPQLAAAGGKQLTLSRLSLAGCSLARHAGYLADARAGRTAKARVYQTFVDPTTGEKRAVTLIEALHATAWDVVTLQQVSSQSFKRDSFQPHLDELISAIHEFAPSAEILIHQTWAYREDHPFFQKHDGFTATAMHEGLTANYRAFAEEKHLRLIPVGDAFNFARQTPRWRYAPDPQFDFQHPPAGRLPDQHASLNLGWRWTQKDGQPVFALDASHCNTSGRYLGANVWFAVLFETEELPTTFTPPDLTPEDAADLRVHALAAVRAARLLRSQPSSATAAAP